MTRIRKAIACVTISAMMISSLAINVYAAEKCFKVGTATARATLDVSSGTATATTSINVASCPVYVSIYGQYYIKGTTTVDDIGNGNGSGTSGTSTSISNNGGTWIYVSSSHSASYGDASNNVTINW